MKKTPGTDGAWGLLCVAMLRNENEQVQQPWQIRWFSTARYGRLAWQASGDERGGDTTIAPLCDDQGNGDALSVPGENDNDEADEAASKTNGKASADSETEGNATTSATDKAGTKEETSDDIVQEEPAAA